MNYKQPKKIKLKRSENIAEIIPFKQKIYKKNKIYGVEILARALDINGNILPPQVIFEKLKKENLQKYYDLLKDYYGNIFRNIIFLQRYERYFININFNDFRNNDFFIFIKNLISETDENVKKKIYIEVVEKRIEDFEIKIAKEFKKNGLKIALDDFGTGMANMEQLLEISPDLVKIDRFFIKFKNNTCAYNVFRSIINTYKNVIVEGIETKDEYDFFMGENVLMQGFFLHMPEKIKDDK